MNSTQIPFGQSVIGTCSICGGPVCVPTVFGSIIPPTPTCARCGAVKQECYGPVIVMNPVVKKGGE